MTAGRKDGDRQNFSLRNFICAEDVAVPSIQLTSYRPENCQFLQIKPLQWSRATSEQHKQEGAYLSPFREPWQAVVNPSWLL